MKIHRWGAVAVVSFASAIACSSTTGTTTSSPSDPDAGEAGAPGDGGPLNPGDGGDGGASFDPEGFDGTCSTASDCLLVEPMDACTVACCGTRAVRDTPQVRAAQQAAAQACPERTTCTKACTRVVAACVGGRCEAQEADAGDGG